MSISIKNWVILDPWSPGHDPFLMQGHEHLQDERPNGHRGDEKVYKGNPKEIKPMHGCSCCLWSFYQFLRCFWSMRSRHLRSCCCVNSNFLKLQTHCVRSAEANMLTQNNVYTHKMLPFCVRISICNLRDFLSFEF